MSTFEVPLTNYLEANPEKYNTSHTVIIREWGRSRHITNWKIGDGFYFDRDGEKIELRNSQVSGHDSFGEEHTGSVLSATILLPLKHIYEKSFKAILCVNNLGYIGKDNTLIWRCSEDLAHFKKLTMGQTLLVGGNTASKLPPLKNRGIVIDDRIMYQFQGIDWCIGGKKTYEKYAPYFTELHISHINDNSIGDTMMPDFRNLNPDCQIFNYYFEPNK